MDAQTHKSSQTSSTLRHVSKVGSGSWPLVSIGSFLLIKIGDELLQLVRILLLGKTDLP